MLFFPSHLICTLAALRFLPPCLQREARRKQQEENVRRKEECLSLLSLRCGSVASAACSPNRRRSVFCTQPRASACTHAFPRPLPSLHSPVRAERRAAAQAKAATSKTSGGGVEENGEGDAGEGRSDGDGASRADGGEGDEEHVGPDDDVEGYFGGAEDDIDDDVRWYRAETGEEPTQEGPYPSPHSPETSAYPLPGFQSPASSLRPRSLNGPLGVGGTFEAELILGVSVWRTFRMRLFDPPRFLMLP